LVPRSSPGQLLADFNIASHFGSPTGHLPDFFHRANYQPPYNRLFDFVEVPSAYVGTRSWYDPGLTKGMDALPFLLPPFNHVSRMRDPGRVNINTIFDQAIWRGIAKAFPPMDTDECWAAIVKSREGFGGQSAERFPTQFANPFRAATSSDLVPLTHMQHAGAQGTLLRSSPRDRYQPLFSVNSLTYPAVIEPHRNQNRSAFFYYQGLNRLGNLLTTHSNVFAVWITVGYFEVQPDSGSEPGHRDYRLGQELGADTGQVARHRAFYVVDRSIPVGFQPGHNLNVDQTIILRRFIE
jgi:hypothetical protein